jgi:hypothetical protein
LRPVRLTQTKTFQRRLGLFFFHDPLIPPSPSKIFTGSPGERG